jgi:hypothetical protein
MPIIPISCIMALLGQALRDGAMGQTELLHHGILRIEPLIEPLDQFDQDG